MTGAAPSRFGALLRQHRLAAGLTQEALAERAGISAKAVSELERDPKRSPRLDTVSLVAEALGLDGVARARFLEAARPAVTIGDSALPRGADLPRPLTPLVGREGVVDAVADAVSRGEAPILTLTGPGGVGKTRVALAAAERVAADFPDGVVFVDLSPLAEPDLVVPAIAQRLGVDERHQEPLIERVTAALRDRRLLLVLDNLEHLLPAHDTVLALAQQCPRLGVLVTSRVPLRVRGEREYRIAPLELPTDDAAADNAAVRLFVDRARDAGVDLGTAANDVATIAETCRRLDGLPLAIELAAAWSRVFSPSALLARLDRRLPLLVDGPHDLPARQRTMRDAIAWSYDLLDTELQRRFRCLCLFAGGCTPEAAAAVCGDAPDTPATLRALTALVDRNLLVSVGDASGPRFTTLETIREFGLEQLDRLGETALRRQAHAMVFLNLAERAHATHETTMGDLLERDHGNLRAALGWLVERQDGATAMRLASALWPFWSERAHLSEGRRWLRQVLDLPGDPAVRGRTLVGAAILASEQGAHDEAARCAAEAVVLARERGVPEALVSALNAHGRVTRERGEYDAALASHGEALELARACGDQRGEGLALSGLSYARGLLGDLPEGTAAAEESARILREAGTAHDLGSAMIGLIANLSQLGAFERVEAIGTEALALFRALGDAGKVADTLLILGLAAQFRGQFERAVHLHEENLALRRARGDVSGAAEPLSALAGIALLQGDYLRARELLDEALAMIGPIDSPWSRSLLLVLRGHAELAIGDINRAAALFVKGGSLMRDIGNHVFVPLCLEGLAGVAARRDAWELAARLCGSRDALHAGMGLGSPPADPAMYSRTRERSRAMLGDDAFAVALQSGRSLSLGEALAEIEAIPPAPPAV